MTKDNKLNNLIVMMFMNGLSFDQIAEVLSYFQVGFVEANPKKKTHAYGIPLKQYIESIIRQELKG